MHGRKRVQLEIIIQVLSLGGGYAAHVASGRWDIALVVTLALECFIHFIFFLYVYRHTLDKLSDILQGDVDLPGGLKTAIADLQHLRSNAIPLEHLLPDQNDWPFTDLALRVMDEFKRNIRLVSDGSYSIPTERIQDISLTVCDYMEHGAFCTAPEENLDIFETQRGRELLAKQYAAAKRIADSERSRTGFTRLFLFDNLNSIQWPHFKLMRENNNNFIEVLVAEKSSVKDIFKRFEMDESMDFGQWKKSLLMEIIGTEPERLLHITRKDEDLRTIARLITELKSRSHSYEEFPTVFRSPINLKLWSTEPEAVVELDVPDGPHQKDCETMFDLALPPAKSSRRLAIYGLTKLFIDKAEQLTASSSGPHLAIDVIDARSFAPRRRSSINYVKANWLDWAPAGYKYDAILADDILCNLSYWQTPLFFECLSETLNSGGLFVFRTTAKFSPGLVNPSWEDLVPDLQKFDHKPGDHGSSLSLDMLSPGAVYELSWPTLHTDKFYDEESRTLSFAKWNDAVTKSTSLSVNLRNALLFKRSLVLTSMEYQVLRTMWAPYFRVAQAELSAYSKWENDPALSAVPESKEIARRFHEYYRLVVLQRL